MPALPPTGPTASAHRIEAVELVRWWRALPPSAGPARVLAVDGPSGAGKTTLAAALAALAPDAVVVRLDEIYPGWDGLAATPGLLLEQLLEPLAAGRPAGYRRWDWTVGTAGRWQPVPPPGPGALLMLDGIGAGARACAPHLAGLIWLDADPDRRRSRALARDGDGYRPHWSRWADQERAYLERERPAERADLVLDADTEVLREIADRRSR